MLLLKKCAKILISYESAKNVTLCYDLLACIINGNKQQMDDDR